MNKTYDSPIAFLPLISLYWKIRKKSIIFLFFVNTFIFSESVRTISQGEVSKQQRQGLVFFDCLKKERHMPLFAYVFFTETQKASRRSLFLPGM
jgi:hypothetical protein